MEYQISIKSKRNTLIPATVCIPDNKEEFNIVFFSHGFCSNRDEYGAFSSLANKLVKEGIGSIRIDYAGCNDSKESYFCNTIDNDVDDLRSAYEYMTNNYRVKRKAFVGYSLGAKVVTHYLVRYADTDVVVMFAPAISNNLDWKSSITLGKQEEMEKAYTIAKENGCYEYLNDFDGSHISLSKDFIEQCLSYKTLDLFCDFVYPTLMIYGDNDDIVPLDIYNNIIFNNHNPLFETHLIKGANHGFGMWDNNTEQFQELVNTAFKYILEKM